MKEESSDPNNDKILTNKPNEIIKKNDNSFKDDSIIFIENVNIEMVTINSINSENKKEELKLSLEHLFNGFLEEYNKKNYIELIAEIESKKEIFYKNSIESFKIYILKIKSIIRLMINDYYQAIIKENNINETAIDYLNRLLNEFKKIKNIINKTSKYENEIITQIYCKFLIILSLYEIRKENRAKSLIYITLGLNMMKIFFVKEKIATDIKTYINYIKLILLFINSLITDNNYILALYYINFGFKLLKIIFRVIEVKKLDKKYYKKALDYSSFNCIYCGICLEHNSLNLYLSIDSFRQANYFLEKSNSINHYGHFSSIFKNRNNRLKYENIFYLVSNATIKLIKNDIKNRIKEQINKTKEEKEKLEKLIQDKEKKEKLKYISNGLCFNYKKFFPIEKKIYKDILTPKTIINIEKTDKELSDFAYNQKENNNISDKIKKNLSRYKIYNELISEQFREFIVKNDKLLFHNPMKIRDNLNKIRMFLNINAINENEYNNLSDNLKEKKVKSNNISRNLTLKNILKKNKTNLNTEYKNLKLYHFNTINDDSYKNNFNRNNIKLLENSKSYTYNEKIINKNINNLKSKSMKYFRRKKNLKIFNIKTYNNKSKIRLNKQKYNLGKTLENDFDRKYLDKYLTTKKYQDKYFDYENLMKRELKFQKIFLNIKKYNSKLYLDDYQKELIKYMKENKSERNYNSKEKAIKTFLVINNKVNDEIFGNKATLQKILNEHKKKINHIAQGFKLLGKATVDDEKMKNCWNKVIQRYIMENREKKLGKFGNYIDNKEIKKKNEKHILKLNHKIKKIDYELNEKKIQYKNSS